MATRAALTSGAELERLFQRRIFWFNIVFVLSLAPFYLVTAALRASTLNWWVTCLVFGGAALIMLWTRHTGNFRRGLFWLQFCSFFSLSLGAVQTLGVDSPSFWWMSVIPVVSLMGGLTRLGVVQGLLVMSYACVAFLVHSQGTAALISPSLRLHMAIMLSTLYVCANLVFAMFWRGKLQAALQQATAAALASAGAKARFLAHMSHEIRTPLSGVIGAAELLRSERTDAEQRQQLATLQEQSAKTLLALINDILDWSKLEAGKVQLERQAFSVRRLVSETNELFAVSSIDRQIELTSSCTSEVPQELIGDPTRIRQVLNNLVGNAVKFTAQGSVHIHVATRQLDARDWLRIEVTDSGAGIAPEALGDVFDAFRQADESVTRRYGGTGLGLSISKELAELMGGRIELESFTGRGSTFTLVLPLQPVPGQPSAPAPAPRQDLLVACGSPGLVRHMQSLLNEVGIAPRLVTALPGPQDLQSCQLLLVDATLLGPPGTHDFAGWLAQVRQRGIRLVLMQPLGTEGGVEDSLPLYKPIRRSALEAMLAPDPVAPVATVAPLPAAALEGPGLRILLCEDNPVNQIVVQVMLKELGASVELAGNGREGLARLQAGHFDLVLMDMQMPDMDGLSATREWRRIESGRAPGRSRVPIVCMTANSRADEGAAAAAAGMDDFLPKPFGIKDLKACLARWAPVRA